MQRCLAYGHGLNEKPRKLFHYKFYIAFKSVTYWSLHCNNNSLKHDLLITRTLRCEMRSGSYNSIFEAISRIRRNDFLSVAVQNTTR